MHKLSLAALLFLQCVFAFAQYTPATVPNTKLINNSYVSNPDGIISGNAVAQIDSTLINLERQTTAQVAVVILRSIGDADIFNFAQELFTLWGPGKTNNNGLLILLVEDLHTVRFHTGMQLEGVLPDVVCKQIQRDQMVPSFKAGDYDTGMINGVNEVAKILTDPNYAAEITATEEIDVAALEFSSLVTFVGFIFGPIFLIAWALKKGKFADSKPADPTDYPQMRMKLVTWLILFGGIPALIVLLFRFVDPEHAIGNGIVTLYLYLLAMVFYRAYRERRMVKAFVAQGKYFELTEYFRRTSGYWFLMALLFPFPFLLYFPIHLVRKNLFRNHSRQCKLCNGDMTRLSEKDEDQFLTKAQIVEEEIKSVDHDVWQCKTCSATETWHFPNRYSKYLECPTCKAVAFYSASTRTIKSATYSSSGTGEEIRQCKSCGKQVKSTYSIAQRTHTTTSSRSSGGSSWSSSSSSSSGGSWVMPGSWPCSRHDSS